MTTTGTSTSTYTRAHTATHISDTLMTSMSEILSLLGINAERLYRDWQQDSTAIAAWINEGSLKDVSLECHRPSGTVDPIFKFPVAYSSNGIGDSQFTVNSTLVSTYMAKLSAVPAGTTFKIFCTFHGSHTPQAGWGAGTLASTAGLRSRSIGTLANAPHASASIQIFRS
jgi:hypothetical protein